MHLSPRVNKVNLNHEAFNSFCPIPNQVFISMSVENVQSITTNEIYQSAYKQHHSRETALIMVLMIYCCYWIFQQHSIQQDAYIRELGLHYTKLKDFDANFKSDKLNSKFCPEISALIYSFTCKITKLPWQHLLYLDQCQDGVEI